MNKSENSSISPQLFAGGALVVVAIFLIIAIVVVMTRADSADVTVDNATPTIDNVYLVDQDEVTPLTSEVEGTTITTDAGTTATFYINVEVSDLNGQEELIDSTDADTGEGVTLTLYDDDATGGASCTADGYDCYTWDSGDFITYDTFTTTQSGVLNAGQCTVRDDATPADNTAIFVCRGEAQYYMESGLAATDFDQAGAWSLTATVTDINAGSSGAETYAAEIEVAGSMSGTVYTGDSAGVLSSLNFGTMTAAGGASTDSATTRTYTRNMSNVPIDITVRAAENVLTHTNATDTIPLSNLRYQLTENIAAGDWDTMTSLTTSDVEAGLTVAIRNDTTATADAYDEVYWSLNIPTGTRSGDYSVVVYQTAVAK